MALSLVPLRPRRGCDCQAGDDHSLAPRWVSGVWRRRSRNPVGRPKISAELRTLIGKMSRANPLWDAPHIHGELLNMCRHSRPPSRDLHTLLSNHADGIAAVDLCHHVTPNSRWSSPPILQSNFRYTQGPRYQLAFQAATFVAPSQGEGLRPSGFDERSAKFCRHSIFDFSTAEATWCHVLVTSG